MSSIESLERRELLHGGAPMLPVNDGLVLRLSAEFGPMATGDAVSGWADLSQNGNTLSLVSGTPRLHSDMLNGHDVVVFDGVDDALGGDILSGLSSGAEDRTLFFIGRYDVGGAGGFSYGNASANEAFGLQIDGDGSLAVDASGADGDFGSSTDAVAAGWMMQSVVLEGDQVTHYLNGNVIDQFDHAFSTDNQLVRLGTTLDGSSFAAMSVAEILVYDRALTNAERTSLESQLLNTFLPELGDPAPTITSATASVVSESDPMTIAFSGEAIGSGGDISYRWAFGDGQQAFTADGTHTYAEKGRYAVDLFATDQNGTTRSQAIIVDIGDAPVVTLTMPSDGIAFRGGDLIAYEAEASDPDGNSAELTYDWELLLMQNGIAVPTPIELGKTQGGSFVVPSTGRALDENSTYRLTVTVTDADGIATTEHVTLTPETVSLAIQSSPAGIPVIVDRVPTATPNVETTLVGFEHELVAHPTYCLGGVRHVFQGWSIGASATQTFEVPAHDSTLIANYLAAGSCNLGEPGDGLIGEPGMDLAGRAGNAWWIGASTGTEFINEFWGTWEGTAPWVDVQVADVDGDGLDDILGRQDGHWYVARSQGDAFQTEHWGRWATHVNWEHVRVGDFNGDGKDDVAGYEGGRWWVALSTEGRFVHSRWTTWRANAGWQDVQVGDFNGDGKDDLAGRTANGTWWVAVSEGDKFRDVNWGSWPQHLLWQDVQAADMNGDGLTDLLGRADDAWWVSLSNGSSFDTAVWGGWPAGANWQDIVVGDLNGDGKDDVAGRADGEWWVAESTGSEFTSSVWGQWGTHVTWENVQAGDVNGDGRDDVLGRANGRWWVALSTGDELVNVLWTRWSNTTNWQNVLLGNFSDNDRNMSVNSADFDADGDIDDADIDLLSQAIRDGSDDPRYDMNGDQTLGAADLDLYITTIVNTVPGDSNLDGRFTTQDLVQVFQRGLYERADLGTAGWADGDWNGDGLFNSRDLVHAMIYGAFTTETFPMRELPGEVMIPEPPTPEETTETSDAGNESTDAIDMIMADENLGVL